MSHKDNEQKEHFEEKIISGKLPRKVSHNFSYLVCNRAGGEEKYYELKPAYHKDHKAGGLFNQWWAVIRRQYDVAQALVKRTRKVFARASIKPVAVRYMTSVHWYKDSVLYRQRHVMKVVLTESDFRFLETGGYLREYNLERYLEAHAKYQTPVMAGLIPYKVIRNRMMKKR